MTPKEESDGALTAHVVPSRANRFVLFHFHIFKNAGTTIEFALRRAFNDRFTLLDGQDANSVLSGSDAAAFLLGNPEIVAISSHHLKYPKPVVPGVVVFDLCILRDPLEGL